MKTDVGRGRRAEASMGWLSQPAAALHVALLAAGVGEGDEMIAPAITWLATGSVALMSGLVSRDHRP